jgi:hypothetical protein
MKYHANFMIGLYNTHGHKLRIPAQKKAQFVTALGIAEAYERDFRRGK